MFYLLGALVLVVLGIFSVFAVRYMIGQSIETPK